MEKGFKYRIYPTKAQEEQIQNMVSAKRFVWNHFLKLNMDRFENKERILTYNQMSSLLTKLKSENLWLYNCEKSILQNTLKDLSKAYRDFLKSNMHYSEKTLEKVKRKGKQLTFYDLDKHPKFKSYKDTYKSIKINYTNKNIEVKEKEIQYTSTGKYKKQNCKIKIPKIKEVKIAYSRQFQGRILSATISKTSDDKYYISLCCTDIEEQPINKTNEAIGIDLGLIDFAAMSTGEIIKNPKYYGKYEAKLKREQQKLSRRKIEGKNRNKQKLKVSLIHKKIRDCRTDFLHQLTTRLIRENEIICLENLKVSNMLKNHKLSKSIADASWYEFRRQLEYKSKWNDKTICIVDTYYPSSQRCSNCGYINEELKDLKIRFWECPKCGVYHENRDVNAAINIKNEGLRMLSA